MGVLRHLGLDDRYCGAVGTDEAVAVCAVLVRACGRYFMKNSDSDAQIPELVATAMTADYAYSLDQLKKLPLAEEILNDVLNPGSGNETSERAQLALAPSAHAPADVYYPVGVATQDPRAASMHGYLNENGHADAPAHAGMEHHCVPARPPPAPNRSKTVKNAPALGKGVAQGLGAPTLGSATSGILAPGAGTAAAAAEGSGPAARTAAPAGGKKGAAGGKGQGGKAGNGQPLSKQQAKQQQQQQQQQQQHAAHHHAHAHAAHQHMMMGHIHPGYMGYAPMPPHGAAYGIPYAMHHKQVMAHMQGLEYAAMPAPGSEFLEPSARDRYANAPKGGKDAAARAVHAHNPYAGVNLSHIMGKPVATASKAASAKGPAGKGKCKPPRASGVNSATAKSKAAAAAGKEKLSSSGCAAAAPITNGNNEFAALGAAKGSRGTRVVQGKLVAVEPSKQDLLQSPPGYSILPPGCRDSLHNGHYAGEDYKDDESPGLHSFLTLSSPALDSSQLCPATPYVLAPLSTDKGSRAVDVQGRMGPDGTPGSTLAGQPLPGAQWFLSPLLQSKDSPGNVWRNSPFMHSTLSPQVCACSLSTPPVSLRCEAVRGWSCVCRCLHPPTSASRHAPRRVSQRPSLLLHGGSYMGACRRFLGSGMCRARIPFLSLSREPP